MGNLDLDQWRAIIKHLKKNTKVKNISVSGGEPLMYRDLIPLIKTVKSFGISVNLLTNGSLVTAKIADDLVSCGVNLFEVSIVAHNSRLHREIVGTDNFEKVASGVRNIKKSGGSIVGVFVANSKNIGFYKEIVDYMIYLGCDALMFNRMNPACSAHLELIPQKDELEEAIAYLDKFSQKYDFQVISSVPIPPCVVDMNKYKNIGHGYCPLGGKSSYYTIDFSGNVRVCNHSSEILGNLLDTDLRDILESDGVKRFKTEISQHCKSCDKVDICKGGCKAASLVCKGGYGCTDPFVER
jgi:radical SAM protein with 4Fe4S-binding SPASM domain